MKAWRYATGAVLIGSAAIVALYSEGFASLVSVWSTSAAHRFLFLVPFLFLYFTWLRVPVVAALSPRPSVLGLLYALPFGCLWFVAEAAQIAVAAQVAAVGMLQAVFLTVLGWRVCRALIFPLSLLWLMVPFGDVLTPPLTQLTTHLTVAGLRLVGMPVTADGNLLTVDGARYAIVAECSGFDFLVANLLVSLVFANLLYRKPLKQGLYVLASLPLAIVANSLRTTAVIVITAATGRSVDLASDHRVFGWLLFFLAMAAQMAIGFRYRDSRAGALSAADSAAVDAVPPASAAAQVAALCSIVLVAAAAPAYTRLRLDSVVEPGSVRLCLPPTMAPAREPSDGTDAWHPAFPRASVRVHRVVGSEDQPIDLFIAYYWAQGRGRELVASSNRLSDGRHWRRLSGGADTVQISGEPMSVATERLAGPARHRRLVWYWYWVGGQFVDRAWLAKLIQARASLLGGERRSAVIVLSTEEIGSEAGARQAMAKFLATQEIRGTLEDAAADRPGQSCP